jgi:FeS assembly SUF system protein
MSDRVPLSVLPTSGAAGKLDELRKAVATPSSSPALAHSTVVDRALDPALSDDHRVLRERIIEALQTVYDPELPVNIFDLGLIYKIEIDADFNAKIEMTLTAPGCPVAGVLPGQVQQRAEQAGAQSCEVKLVWDPPWTKDRMSEAAMLELGLF